MCYRKLKRIGWNSSTKNDLNLRNSMPVKTQNRFAQNNGCAQLCLEKLSLIHKLSRNTALEG